MPGFQNYTGSIQADMLIQREVNSEMLALNREIYAQGSRRELFRQWGFVIVSFALGFVVNWLSTPALELFRGFHF